MALIYESSHGSFEPVFTCDSGMGGCPVLTMLSSEPIIGDELYEEELTTELPNDPAFLYGKGCSYLNGDISKKTIRFLEDNHLATFAGHIASCGFGSYFLYQFDMKKLEEHLIRL